MTEEDIDRATRDARMICNRRKIAAAVASAAATNEVIAQYGSFDAYLRSFDDPKNEIQNQGLDPGVDGREWSPCEASSIGHNHELPRMPFVKGGTETSADIETHRSDYGLHAPLRSGSWTL
jgi:hypothetical protein